MESTASTAAYFAALATSSAPAFPAVTRVRVLLLQVLLAVVLLPVFASAFASTWSLSSEYFLY